MIEPNELRQRELSTTHGVNALKLVPNGRAYALDDHAAAQLGAVAMAYRDRELAAGRRFEPETLAKLLEQLAQDIPELVQERPAPEPATPKMPVDPVTGAPIKNPWSEPVDLASQTEIARRDPALAEHLKKIKNGVRYVDLIKAEEERAKRERLRAIKYAEKEHRANPYHGDSLSAKSEFAKQHGEEVAAFYRHEAATPVSLAFDNMSIFAQIHKKDPAVAALYKQARELHKRWIADDVARLEALSRETGQELARKQQVAAATR